MATKISKLTLAPYLSKVDGRKRWKWKLSRTADGETHSVTFNTKPEGKAAIHTEIRDAHALGYTVDALFIDQTGGGTHAIYDPKTGTMVEETVKSDAGLLGPRCHELPRGYVTTGKGGTRVRTESGGITSVRRRAKALSAHNTWDDLKAALKEGTVGLRLDSTNTVVVGHMTKTGKGRYQATLADFSVVAGLIIAGSKALGSFSPIFTKPRGLPVQHTMAQVKSAIEKSLSPATTKPKPKPKPTPKPKPAKVSAPKQSPRRSPVKQSPPKQSPRRSPVKQSPPKRSPARVSPARQSPPRVSTPPRISAQTAPHQSQPRRSTPAPATVNKTADILAMIEAM